MDQQVNMNPQVNMNLQAKMDPQVEMDPQLSMDPQVNMGPQTSEDLETNTDLQVGTDPQTNKDSETNTDLLDKTGRAWTEKEEERFFDLLDRSNLDGRNSQYPKLSYEKIADIMNAEAREKNEVIRIYTRQGICNRYKLHLAYKYVTTAALAEAMLRTAQSLDKVVEDAMLAYQEADRRVNEIRYRLVYAAVEHGHDMYGNHLTSQELVDASSVAAQKRIYFQRMAEDAAAAIKKAQRAFRDAEVTEFLSARYT